MFTGIVEEIGHVKSVSGGRIEIGCELVLEGTKLGDSIAVNGVCLTVTCMSNTGFTADVMPETLRRSNLGELGYGSIVDLERAMAADGRFGGYIVSGHIDGTGRISEMRNEGNAVWVKIAAEPEITRYIVKKGSVTIDGISLTVADVAEGYFLVSVIPHTGGETVLLKKNIGDTVNLENDIVAKYIEKLMQPKHSENEEKSNITLEFLEKNGF